IICIASSTQAAAASPTAAEIVEAAKAAMAQPLRFRVVTADTEMLTYQKPLPDGSVASLCQMTAPLKRITIIFENKSYELYLDQAVAVETTFIFQAARDQAAGITKQLPNSTMGASRIVGSGQHDGHDCFDIETTVASDVFAALLKVAPPNVRDAVPAVYRQLI